MSVLRHPMASYRLAVATRYWHSARIVLAQQIRDAEFMEPVGHLLSMTAELSLKAYLLEHGVTDQEMGKHGLQHDLGEILRRCLQHGLRLGEQEVQMILVLRTAHLQHFQRYGPRSLDGAYAIIMANEQPALSLIARVLDIIAGDPKDLRHLHERSDDLDWPVTEMPAEPVTMPQFHRMKLAAEAEAKAIEGFGIPHKRPKAKG